MTEVNVIIEISKGSHIKYEYDKENKILICDRILHTPMKYPFNYGFIPNTLSEDGDPLDVVVLMDDEMIPGSMIKCKILGYLDTKDDAGNDPKIIVCPIDKVDPMWKSINNLLSTPDVNLNYAQHENSLIAYSSNSTVSYKDKDGASSLCINPIILKRVKYFFEHYKDLENKKVEVGSFYNKDETIKVYNDSLERYKCNSIQKSKITNFFKKT
jgi:inorganic pyrophosphatase